MKIFHAIVTRPFVYGLRAPREKSAPDIAWVKFKEAVVAAQDQKEADKKIRAVLPPADPKILEILLQSGIGGEYYSVQFKEIEGKDGVYFC